MNQQRLKAKLNSQSRIAIAIYDKVPAEVAWPARAIYQEFAKTGKSCDWPRFEGCLHSLKEDGLIKRQPGGEYVKTKVSTKPIELKIAAEVGKPAQLMALPGRIEKAATSLKYWADSLEQTSKTAQLLHDELVDIALELDEEKAESNERDEKFKQLQGLLGELSGGQQ